MGFFRPLLRPRLPRVLLEAARPDKAPKKRSANISDGLVALRMLPLLLALPFVFARRQLRYRLHARVLPRMR